MAILSLLISLIAIGLSILALYKFRCRDTEQDQDEEFPDLAEDDWVIPADLIDIDDDEKKKTSVH